MSVSIEYKKSDALGFILMQGTKVFLDNGEELKGITKIGMPTKGVDDILEVTLTIPVSNIIVK